MDQPTSRTTSVNIDPSVQYATGSPSFNTSGRPRVAEVLLIPIDGKIVLAVLYAIIIIIAFGGNFLVIIIITATRRLRSVTNFFLASQGLSDAIMSFVCVPWTFVATTLLDTWPFGEMFCKLALYLQAGGVCVCVCLCACVFERVCVIVCAGCDFVIWSFRQILEKKKKQHVC